MTQKTKSDEKLEKEWLKMLFGVRKSVRYHRRRQHFFDSLSKTGNILTAIGGSATVAALLGTPGSNAALILAAATAIFAAIDIVVGTAVAARRHDDLARRFIDIEKKMVTATPSREAYNEAVEERLTIESDEPPPLKVLDSICHNELLRAMGYDKSKYVNITWVQRSVSQLFDFRESTISSS